MTKTTIILLFKTSRRDQRDSIIEFTQNQYSMPEDERILSEFKSLYDYETSEIVSYLRKNLK